MIVAHLTMLKRMDLFTPGRDTLQVNAHFEPSITCGAWHGQVGRGEICREIAFRRGRIYVAAQRL